MSLNRSSPDQDTLLADAWGHVVGGMEWLQSVLFGEFSDHRPLSAVVADMLVSFIPGVVIVTSARDVVAVVLRLATHPEKREELMEWVLLCACLIVIALPIAMAAGSAVALGVGAVVGGVAGSELGAALRAVMLLLIKEASKLAELLRFLQKFMEGDILKFLRAIRFSKYEKALIQAVSKITGKLVEVVKALRVHLENLRYFETVKGTIAKLAEWEAKFYSVQHDALRQVPKALAELDARLANVLAQSAPKEVHTAVAGVRTENIVATPPMKQRVRDTSGKVLEKGEVAILKPSSEAASHVSIQRIARTEPESSASLKSTPEPITTPEESPNTKKQTVIDATIAVERERITRLSKEGKIDEARAILRPHVDAAKNAKTVTEKEAAMKAIIARLDVTSDREKMFWSGNKELAAKIAAEKGKTILEQTPGGKVIDGWGDLNETFSWNAKDMGPHGWNLWGDVSAEYAKDATGEIEIIQDIEKFPAGGPTWRAREWTTIVDEGKVTAMKIYGMDKSGNILKSTTIEPDGAIAKKLFGEGS